MSDTQKKLLMYGVPIVAAIALLTWYRSRNAAKAPAGTLATGTTAPNNNAVGIDQLTAFENSIQGEIQGLISSGATSVTPSPTPSTPTPAAAFNPYPKGTTVAVTKAGTTEKIVQSVAVGAGYVDVTSLGGLYAVGVPAVGGSAYSPTPPPKGFTYSATVNNGTIYEYTPTGVKIVKL